jgi:hypothetical protein
LIERGEEGQRTNSRSGKSDPKAKNLANNPEKKGAAPPEKPSLTIDKPTLSGSYETKKATMADTTVQTSESDKGKDLITSTKMPPSRILAPETPDHRDEAASSKEDEEITLIKRGSNQELQVPRLTVGGKTIRTPQKALGSIASDASFRGSRESRTRGDAAQIAEGIPLTEKFSKKQAKKGTGRGRADLQTRRADLQRRSLLDVRAEVKKLENEAKAAKIAADKASKAKAGNSKRSETERYIDSQTDKSGHINPQVAQDLNPPSGDSSDPGSSSNKETENSVLDSVSMTSSQREEYRTDKSFLTKTNVKLLSKFKKDGKMKETIINRIQQLTADVPTSFRKFETDYKDQDSPNLDNAYYCLDDQEKNLKEKACWVQLATDYLNRTGENLLNLLAHNMFNECAKVSKQICQNLYKKINLDKSNSEDIRCGFKAALRCLESAVYLLLDVLKAHNLRTKDNLANISVV